MQMPSKQYFIRLNVHIMMIKIILFYCFHGSLRAAVQLEFLLSLIDTSVQSRQSSDGNKVSTNDSNNPHSSCSSQVVLCLIISWDDEVSLLSDICNTNFKLKDTTCHFSSSNNFFFIVTAAAILTHIQLKLGLILQNLLMLF